jgi:dTDP-4-dehydrorhamnose 3,5-epimerase
LRFTAAALPGVFTVDLKPHEDERGFFARTWCRQEFAAHGLNDRVVQCSISFSKRRGTLRGLHYQAPPHAEDKLVRCTHGAIFDVILDLRRDSPTFCRHVVFELTAERHRSLYIPKGCAHGFQTLTDDVYVLYQMSEFYAPDAARGIRWDDARFAIEWPIRHPILHPRDACYPDFVPDSDVA